MGEYTPMEQIKQLENKMESFEKEFKQMRTNHENLISLIINHLTPLIGKNINYKEIDDGYQLTAQNFIKTKYDIVDLKDQIEKIQNNLKKVEDNMMNSIDKNTEDIDPSTESKDGKDIDQNNISFWDLQESTDPISNPNISSPQPRASHNPDRFTSHYIESSTPDNKKTIQETKNQVQNQTKNQTQNQTKQKPIEKKSSISSFFFGTKD